MTRRTSTPILLATGNPDKQAEFRRLSTAFPSRRSLPPRPASPAPRRGGRHPRGHRPGQGRPVVLRRLDAGHRLRRRAGGSRTGGAMGEPLHAPLAGPAAGNDERLARLLELMGSCRGEDRARLLGGGRRRRRPGPCLVSWELSRRDWIYRRPAAGRTSARVLGLQLVALSRFGKTYTSSPPPSASPLTTLGAAGPPGAPLPYLGVRFPVARRISACWSAGCIKEAL